MRFSFLLLGFCLTALGAGPADFYVAPNGNDAWSGKLAAPNGAKTDGPLASPAKALMAVRAVAGTKSVTIMLRGGTYYLPLSPTSPGTLVLTGSDSGSAASPITWQNYPGETPVISGGEPVGKGGLGLTWKNAGGNLWQVELPAGVQPFEHLFYNGARRLRSRLQSAAGTGYYMRGGSCYSTVTNQAVDTAQCNLGSFLRIAAEIPPTGEHAGCPSVQRRDGSVARCLDRFAYNPADPIGKWINLNPSGSKCGGDANSYPVGDVELTLFDAWTVDMMRVSCVDTDKHIIYLTGRTKGNPGVFNMFGPVLGHRYIVENTKDAFDAARAAGQSDLWFLDRSTSPWTLNYLAGKGENPNAASVVIAQVQPVSPMGGSLVSATDLKYVTFRGITFEVDNYVPPPSGFSNDENSEATLPEAIDCESCQHVTFDGVTVRRTAASGLLIASTSGNSGAPASHDVIENSAFYDIGSSGIRIGHDPRGSDKVENTVQFITVRNNIVQGYSRVFADGEGIAQANGHDISYLHNDVNDGYHAGISVCLLGCPSHEANGANIVSQYNHIWNTMGGITSDGGTLYYNVGNSSGTGRGNKMLNNLVHDTTDASIIDRGVHGTGYGGSGIYLDNQTGAVDVENNVVYRVAQDTVWISGGQAPGEPPNIFKNNIFANGRKALFTLNTPWLQGCDAASLRAEVAGNIFSFDRDDTGGFYPIHGCADSCGLDYNKFVNFQGNLYWRADGAFAGYGKAFHVAAQANPKPFLCGVPVNPEKAWAFLSFSQWQDGRPPSGVPAAMNEDRGSTVSVDPHFGKTGKPTDYLLSKNPIAGFDYTKTNDTIRHAGRDHPILMPPPVPATFPTYAYTDF